MQKINSITAMICFQILTLTGCTEEKYELCGTTGEYEPFIKIAESTASETVTETTSTETTVATTAITTETIAEVTTVVTETTAEETLSETVLEIAEEMQKTETQTEAEQKDDIVYINYSWDNDYYYFDDFTITAEDYILLCNCVAHEAGSDWYSDWDKAKVVEVIFNRMWSSAFPGTIYEVITQPNQFTGSADYANLDGYSYEVTSLCCDGVDLYLSNPDLFNEGYLFFYGDDDANYFY